jgi:hypothetical protein
MSETTPAIIIPAEVTQSALDSIGVFFEPICGVERNANVSDFLDTSKSFKRAEIIRRYTPIEGKKLLEVGSGFGTNLAVSSTLRSMAMAWNPEESASTRAFSPPKRCSPPTASIPPAS